MAPKKKAKFVVAPLVIDGLKYGVPVVEREEVPKPHEQEVEAAKTYAKQSLKGRLFLDGTADGNTVLTHTLTYEQVSLSGTKYDFVYSEDGCDAVLVHDDGGLGKLVDIDDVLARSLHTATGSSELFVCDQRDGSGAHRSLDTTMTLFRSSVAELRTGVVVSWITLPCHVFQRCRPSGQRIFWDFFTVRYIWSDMLQE